MDARPDILFQLKAEIADFDPLKISGRIEEVGPSILTVRLPNRMLGEMCLIESQTRCDKLLGEIIAIQGNQAQVVCLEAADGLSVGSRVWPLGIPHRIDPLALRTGSIYDGFGRPIPQRPGDLGLISTTLERGSNVIRESVAPTDRPVINQILVTKVSVIDAFMTFGRGQRIGIFAPPGCGKTTLMAQIARGADVDVIVFGLVGERGREMTEFLEHQLDDELRAKSICICATSDKTAIERVRAAFTATAIAEYYRDQGKEVLLMIDSLTRLARAQREIGLAAGEPVTAGGMTPSVYSLMPRLIERSGRSPRGTITAIYTVLMEGESITEDPVSSEAKSLLDGHVVLSLKLAEKGHFPAVNVAQSLSRVMTGLVSNQHLSLAYKARSILARCKDLELIVRLNEYQRGANSKDDLAMDILPLLEKFCRQDTRKFMDLGQSMEALTQIVDGYHD
ncbi:MAG TPA: FliI/YscN family ATPase [Limnobacter sp.]|uniref:FliI/YscN family ATPase n=1 Tax=Limnobacter sp. TaxID=2003368 RepID=UPI002EDAA836